MKNKPIITLAFAALFAIVIFSLLSQFAGDVEAPEHENKESFSLTLWSDYAWATIVISLVIFAGGVGVLKLVGGDLKWR